MSKKGKKEQNKTNNNNNKKKSDHITQPNSKEKTPATTHQRVQFPLQLRSVLGSDVCFAQTTTNGGNAANDVATANLCV